MASRATVDAGGLRSLLADFQRIPQTERTGVRRELRHTGDSIIEAQKAILDGPLPSGVTISGSHLRIVKNKKTGRSFVRKVNSYSETEVHRPGRHTGLREGIKAGLVTYLVTGTTRQSIEVRTRNKQASMSVGWNSRRFRHPIFGNKERWAFQAGQPYFFAPVFAGRAEMVEAAKKILNDAIEGR